MRRKTYIRLRALQILGGCATALVVVSIWVRPVAGQADLLVRLGLFFVLSLPGTMSAWALRDYDSSDIDEVF